MNCTLMQLFLILVLAVSIIVPTLYAIVITLFFIGTKMENLSLTNQLNKMQKKFTEIDTDIRKIEQEMKEDKAKAKKRIKAGFELPDEGKEKKENKKQKEKKAA